jgi:Cu-Zn family superoxide dismutase
MQRWLAMAVLASAAGCDRRDGDGLPWGPSPPEVPIVPQIEAAKPGPEDRGSARSAVGTAGGPGSPNAAALAGSAAGHPREAKAEFKTAGNTKLSGGAELQELATGVKFVVEIEKGPPGKKGIHVHEKPDCSDIAGESMGEHFAPNGKAHGLPPDPSRHLGDLGNLAIDEDGRARLEITVSNANLKEKDPMSFLGRALVIHEAEDQGTQPSGGSGKPIACAVIRKD